MKNMDRVHAWSSACMRYICAETTKQIHIYIYTYDIYIYIYIERERETEQSNNDDYIRGNHLSNTTCLRQTFFESGE